MRFHSRYSLLPLLLALCAVTTGHAQEIVGIDSLHVKSEAFSRALTSRHSQLRDTTMVSACSAFLAFDRRPDFREMVSPDVRRLIQPLTGDPCANAAHPHGLLDVTELRIEPLESPGIQRATVRFRQRLDSSSYREETFDLQQEGTSEWHVSRFEVHCCVSPPFASTVVPDGLIVHYVNPPPGPAVLLDGRVLQPSERDSVLRSLHNVMLESIQVYPAEPATEQIFGSRGAQGVVVLVTRRVPTPGSDSARVPQAVDALAPALLHRREGSVARSAMPELRDRSAERHARSVPPPA